MANLGLQSALVYDHDTASRFGISASLLDNTLYDAFGQRQVSTMYTSLNQYHVVVEAAHNEWTESGGLRNITSQSSNGQQVPLSALAHYGSTTAPLTVDHQGRCALPPSHFR